MKFTAKELQSIEATVTKLKTVAYTMWPSESTDYANVRALDYIISEMRLCAQLVASDERTKRVAAYDRLDDLITK
jgi:hypothetical protein